MPGSRHPELRRLPDYASLAPTWAVEVPARSAAVLFRDLIHDARFWVVALTSLCLILTIERVQAYANGPWPQLRRDRSGDRSRWAIRPSGSP